jgi:hypothetical protein
MKCPRNKISRRSCRSRQIVRLSGLSIVHRSHRRVSRWHGADCTDYSLQPLPGRETSLLFGNAKFLRAFGQKGNSAEMRLGITAATVYMIIGASLALARPVGVAEPAAQALEAVAQLQLPERQGHRVPGHHRPLQLRTRPDRQRQAWPILRSVRVKIMWI